MYPESLKQAVKQGYLDKLLAFSSDNPDTMEKMQEIRRIMKDYIAERIRIENQKRDKIEVINNLGGLL